MGFEHSVANMFLIPMVGLYLGCLGFGAGAWSFPHVPSSLWWADWLARQHPALRSGVPEGGLVGARPAEDMAPKSCFAGQGEGFTGGSLGRCKASAPWFKHTRACAALRCLQSMALGSDISVGES